MKKRWKLIVKPSTFIPSNTTYKQNHPKNTSFEEVLQILLKLKHLLKGEMP